MAEMDGNRADQFDRSDFAARPLRASPVRWTPPPAQLLPEDPIGSAQPSGTARPSPAAASVENSPPNDAAITAEHLRGLGWSQAKIQQILGGPESADSPTDSNQAEDATAQTSAYLRSLGWTESDIARLLVGPEQSHLTAEALFRQHAANSTREQEALVKALAQAGAQKIKPDPSLLSGLNTAHLSPESPSDLEQLISQFAALPDVQKQRFLLLLDSQKSSAKTASPKPDAPPKKTVSADGETAKSPGPAGDVLPVVKSSLDLLSTALKGLLGASKGGTKSGGKSPDTRTPWPEATEDESDAEDLESPPEQDLGEEDAGSMDDASDTLENEDDLSLPEDQMDLGSEREPD